jgi:hypothetical protein
MYNICQQFLNAPQKESFSKILKDVEPIKSIISIKISLQLASIFNYPLIHKLKNVNSILFFNSTISEINKEYKLI